jgi:creatinine amidohydrolase
MTTKNKTKRVFRLDKITHSKISKLDRERTLVLATLSPLEVHGPHLPLGQDMFEAYALAEKTAEVLTRQREDWNVLLLPPVPVAIDCVPELGSVNFPVKLVLDVAYHLLRPFAKAGFARLAYSSFHGGPRHICCLEAAADKLTKDFGVPAGSLFSMVLSCVAEGKVFFEAIEDIPEREITLEMLKQDHHAGFVETSMGLHLWPELVEDGWKDLPPLYSSEIEQGQDANDSFLYDYQDKASLGDRVKRNMAQVHSIFKAIKHFNTHTYFGYPALASAEQGKKIFEHLTNICAESAGEFLDRGREMDVHSPLWKMRSFMLNSGANMIADRFGIFA